MLQNSRYSVWFRTPQGEGYGIVSLMDGNVSGADNTSSYTGVYVQDGDKFTATIAVRRHTQGPPFVFGVDNVDVTLSGKSTPTMASCIGTAIQAPGTSLGYPHSDCELNRRTTARLSGARMFELFTLAAFKRQRSSPIAMRCRE
jgi:hypothetical protein